MYKRKKVNHIHNIVGNKKKKKTQINCKFDGQKIE